MSIATRPVSIDGLEFDALMESTESHSAEVPTYPTEEGFTVSDCVIINAIQLSMTLVFSNTPVTWKSTHQPSLGRVQEQIAKLKEIYFAKKPVTVVTTRGIFRNMAILSFELTNTTETFADREIPITFQQIRVTESKTTTIPDSYGRGGTTGGNAGTASTKATATDANKPESGGGSNQSVLYNIGGSLGMTDGGFGGGGGIQSVVDGFLGNIGGGISSRTESEWSAYY